MKSRVIIRPSPPGTPCVLCGAAGRVHSAFDLTLFGAVCRRDCLDALLMAEQALIILAQTEHPEPALCAKNP